MKKDKREGVQEMRAEYHRSDFKKLVRGKYAERMNASINIVVLDDDLTSVFPNSESVNKALHSLVDVARKASQASRKKSTKAAK